MGYDSMDNKSIGKQARFALQQAPVEAYRFIALLSLLVMGTGISQAMPQPDATIVASLRGDVIEIEQIETLSADAIAERLTNAGVPGVPLYGVELYRVVYHTIDVNGEPTQASGAIAIPIQSVGPMPLLSFQHGTVTGRHQVPSEQGFDLVSMGLGASGYVTVLPDYLGLGSSPGLHPYVHAKSLGTAVVDMLRAARQYCKAQGIELSDQLFLMGYSEGGYATMAAHREIQRHHPSEFTVTASAPMAGPYNLSEVMAAQILDPSPYPSPGYLPYTLLSYDYTYGVFEGIEAAMKDAYVPYLYEWYDGSKSLSFINKQLPEVPYDMLHPDFIDSFQHNADHPLRQALAENDVHNWSPKAPMRLYHCVGDDQVSFRNAEKALQAFRAHGADHVELAELHFGDHQQCAPPALFLGKLWFDEFKERSGPAPMQANLKIVKAGRFE